MKIYQIIAEDYDNLALLNTPDKKTTDNSTDASDNPADDSAVGQAKSAVKAATDFLPDIGVDLTTLAIAGVSTIAVAKLSSSALSSLSSNYAKKLKLTARVEGMWKKKFGPWGKVFTAMGIAVALTQLYENLYVTEALYVQGKLPGNDGGYAKLVEQREFEFGVFTTQILAPTLTKWILRAIATATGVKWLIRVLGGISTTATLGASIAGVIASEAFIRWFQWWLGSEQGRNVLFEYFGGIIRTIGTPTESLWSIIVGYYNKADVKKFGSPEAAKAAQADRQTKADAAGSSGSWSGETAKTGFVTDPSVDKSGKLINPTTRIVVTDKDGNLFPNARLMANAQLNLIRSQAVDAGQPDPLTKFAKPGQQLPPIR
jgi:hypothetical protein